MECTASTPKLWDLLHIPYFPKTRIFHSIYLLTIIVTLKKKNLAYQRWFIVVFFRIRFGCMWQKFQKWWWLKQDRNYLSLEVGTPGLMWQIRKTRDSGPLYLACCTGLKFTSWSKMAVEAPAITSELQPAEGESGERACLLLKAFPKSCT